MIKLIRSGQYKLIETKHNNKILYLDNEIYAWIEPAMIGEILVVSHKVHKTDCILSLGQFKLYDVKDEPELADHIHLELDVGLDYWQGYLLLTGLPGSQHKRGRIIPTLEIITANQQFKQPAKR